MTQRSYIDENGEALELDSAWFSKAQRGFPLKPAEKTTAGNNRAARAVGSQYAVKVGDAVKVGAKIQHKTPA